ncbi:MAG: hypothetical protein FJ100_19715 [Deltaproteobacteria bacterium]|nr:hypothetical protein [Deltaproteobacteria bacterium]
MHKPIGPFAWRAALAAGLAVAAAACEQPGNASVLSVEGNVVPQALKLNGSLVCNYVAAQAFYPEGVMDLAQTTTLWYHANVRNNLIATTAINGSNEQLLRNDGNTITVTNVHVVLDRSAGVASPAKSPFDGNNTLFGKASAAIAEWDVPASTLVYPGQKAQVGFYLVPHQSRPGVPVGLDFQARFGFAGFKDKHRYLETLTLRFTIEGKTAAGKTVRSGEIAYPVTFCWGCLLMPVTADTAPPAPDDIWKTCTTFALSADYLAPCQMGNYEYSPCALYCQVCKVKESVGKGAKCDTKFCPPPQTP